MNKQKNQLFKIQLRKVAFFSYLLKLLPIPFHLILAKVMADVITCATQGETRKVFSYAAGILAFVILYKGGLAAFDISFKKKESQILHQCKIQLYYQFLSNPLSALFTSGHGKNIEKLNDDFDTVVGYQINSRPNAWAAVLSVTVYTVFLFVQSKWVAFSLVAISLMQLVPPLIVKKFLEVNYERCREVEAELTEYTVEAYRGFATIKLNKLNTWWLDRLKKLHIRYAKVGNASILTSQTQIALNALVDNILKYGAYAVVGAFVLFQIATLEVGIEAIALSGGLFSSVSRLSTMIPNLAVNKKAVERLSEWFQYEKKAEGKIEKYQIVLSGVSFQKEENLILKDVNQTFLDSKITLIKGENGSGKSTLLRLITGLLECSTGEVRIDGFTPEQLAETNFPATLFYLPQTDIAFNFTAKELYDMVLHQDSEKLRSICSRFQLTRQILCETKIKELSGGERKKVFLSLAFALEPRILFLDEPTNSLDKGSKLVLCDLLKELSGHVLLVSHDSVFDGLADRVYRIEKGEMKLEG